MCVDRGENKPNILNSYKREVKASAIHRLINCVQRKKINISVPQSTDEKKHQKYF